MIKKFLKSFLRNLVKELTKRDAESCSGIYYETDGDGNNTGFYINDSDNNPCTQCIMNLQSDFCTSCTNYTMDYSSNFCVLKANCGDSSEPTTALKYNPSLYKEYPIINNSEGLLYFYDQKPKP